MIEYLRRSWAVVNLDCIEHNYRLIRERLSPGCRMMGVVKADAYGHGDKYIAEQLVRLGVDWFGVSNIDEAMSLRVQGIYHPILIFGATPPEHVKLLCEYNLTQTIFSSHYADRLHAAAEAEKVDVGIHIKVDTGMSRLGFVVLNGMACQSVEEIERICALPHFAARGIYTHFACADELSEESISYTRTQFARFQDTIRRLEQRGVFFAIKHCCNSAGTVNFPEMHMDMVRPGILLYGLCPSSDCEGLLPLRPAMELYSSISMVKGIPADTAVSYGRRYISSSTVKVATVSIGYADGYAWGLWGKARMLVRGQYASVIGRVCMDQLMLDVSDIDGVCEGDVVTIVGTDGENKLSFDEMAALDGTINYEKICLIGKRVPRIYRQGGKDVGIADYVRGLHYHLPQTNA